MPDRLPYHFSSLPAYSPDVAQNQLALEQLMRQLDLHAMLVNAQDRFLTEYTPKHNSPRYAVSGFDGSTGEGIFVRQDVAQALGLSGQYVLFVDGRYHLQAEQQTVPQQVHLEKLPVGVSLWHSMALWLAARGETVRRVGFDSFRVSEAQRKGMLAVQGAEQLQWLPLQEGEIDLAVQLPGWSVDRPVFPVSEAITGRSVVGNLQALRTRLPAGAAFMTGAAADISYVLNSRGYHIPNASSQLGYLFVLPGRVVLFMPQECADSPVNLPEVPDLQVIRNDVPALRRTLAHEVISQVCFSADTVNSALPQWAKQIWPTVTLVDTFNVVENLRVAKTPEEQETFRRAYLRSSRAIARTMRWAKWGVAGVAHSEYDLSRQINDEYRAEGAVALTFTTIAASDAMSALAHYTKASKTRPLQEGALVLLDSGAYYEDGLATDCTRVVLRKTDPTTQAQSWQREIYTVALKACIRGLLATVPASATGHDVDQMVRAVCQQYGHDYSHGTGHGIGIHVHENGVRFMPGSRYGVVPHAVISIEPGIYLAGQGGVRIENIVIIQQDEQPGQVRFENMTFVGYDWELIDLDLLTAEEKDYLRAYEQRCLVLGTAVTDCPLLQA
ncbi:M24 family metallopeptidase [Leeia sp.]|uniref:M24 family metallopeptidase n=1 Tax=Leeia sp. TaxID=2884678 RepID=UPI0035B04083